MSKASRGKAPASPAKRKRRSTGGKVKWTLARRRVVTQRVAECIANGGTLFDVCPRRVTSDDFPAAGTFLSWLLPGQPGAGDLDALYARARKARDELDAEELRLVSKHGTGDEYTDAQGNRRLDLTRAKLYTDNLKWIMARRNPKEWGERMDLTTDGKPVGAVALPGFVPLGAPLDAAEPAPSKSAKRTRKKK